MNKTYLIAFMLFSTFTHAEIYKSTDSNGVVHYSDMPISGNSNQVKLKAPLNKKPIESKTNQEDKNEVKVKSVVKYENSEYCAFLKNELEYNKNGGEIIVVNGNKFEQASEEHRQRSYKKKESQYKEHCLAGTGNVESN